MAGPSRPSNPTGGDEEIAIGKIYKPRGLVGEVFCEPLTDFIERFEDLDEVTVALPSGERRALHIAAARLYGKRLAIRFREYETPEDVGVLRGAMVLIPKSQAHPIEEEDTFYVFDIVGMDVVTDDGEAVGPVKDVLTYPANDVYVVDRGGEEVLIPAVKAHVEIDHAARKIVVRGLEGLL